MKRKIVYIASCFLLLYICFTIVNYWNEYKKKGLLDTFYAQRYKITEMGFTIPPTENYPIPSWYTEDEQVINELMAFLENYQVKKLKKDSLSLKEESQFYFKVTNEKGKYYDVITDGLFLIVNGEYYKILNGAIDGDWIKKYNNKNINNTSR